MSLLDKEFTEKVKKLVAKDMSFFREIAEERVRNDEEWTVHTWPKWCTLLGINYGDICKEVEGAVKGHDKMWLKKNIVKTAAMCLRMLEQLRDEENKNVS